MPAFRVYKQFRKQSCDLFHKAIRPLLDKIQIEASIQCFDITSYQWIRENPYENGHNSAFNLYSGLKEAYSAFSTINTLPPSHAMIL